MQKTISLCLMSTKSCIVKIFSSNGILLAKKMLTHQKGCLCLKTCSPFLLFVATYKSQTQKKYLRLFNLPCQSFAVNFWFSEQSVQALQTFNLLDANYGIAVPKALLTFGS